MAVPWNIKENTDFCHIYPKYLDTLTRTILILEFEGQFYYLLICLTSGCVANSEDSVASDLGLLCLLSLVLLIAFSTEPTQGFSTVILSLPLIQEGQLSVSGERMCTILVNRLED